MTGFLDDVEVATPAKASNCLKFIEHLRQTEFGRGIKLDEQASLLLQVRCISCSTVVHAYAMHQIQSDIDVAQLSTALPCLLL